MSEHKYSILLKIEHFVSLSSHIPKHSNQLHAQFPFVPSTVDFRRNSAFFFLLLLHSPIQALAASMRLSVSLQLLDLGQSVGLLGRVIRSSQGL
jgi:hypothetical protein